jgi:hypothetical protein
LDAYAVQVATAETNLEGYDWSSEHLRTWIADRRGVMEAFVAQGGRQGAAVTGPCTGNRDPADFLLVSELGTSASLACQGAPMPTGGLALALLFGVARRRPTGPRSSTNG